MKTEFPTKKIGIILSVFHASISDYSQRKKRAIAALEALWHDDRRKGEGRESVERRTVRRREIDSEPKFRNLYGGRRIANRRINPN